MELRAMIEAVKMSDGPCTIVSDHEGVIKLAQQGRTPQQLKPLWDELYAALEGKDVAFEWRRRGSSLGARLAHQIAKGAAKGRVL
jgi:hypothetical protein